MSDNKIKKTILSGMADESDTNSRPSSVSVSNMETDEENVSRHGETAKEFQRRKRKIKRTEEGIAKITEKKSKTENEEMKEESDDSSDFESSTELEDRGNRNFRNRIDNIKVKLDSILVAITKESGGKVSVTRADQGAVKDALYRIQTEVLEIVLDQRELDKEIAKIKITNIQLKEELNKKEKELRNIKERKNETMRRNRNNVTVSEGSSSEDHADSRNKGNRTYAEVSGGRKVNERRTNGIEFQGRVVKTGKEGWKTPTKELELALIVSSNREGIQSKELAGHLSRIIEPADIGGAPKAVKEARNGKLLIIPKNKEQKEKITGKIGSIKGLRVVEKQSAGPQLIITGVEKGKDKELIENLKRENEIEKEI